MVWISTINGVCVPSCIICGCAACHLDHAPAQVSQHAREHCGICFQACTFSSCLACLCRARS